MRLGTLDLSILLLYLAGVTALGVWFRRGQRNIRDYFLGNRQMPWWALGLSIVATETSTLTILFTPAVAFAGNLGLLQFVLGYLVARVLICLIFIPAYFRGEFYTAYQLIEKRFGARMKSVAAGTFLLTRTLAEGVRVAAVGVMVTVAFGTGEVSSVVIVLLLTLLYTFYGGLRAVIWTDVMQLTIYLAGGIAAFFLLLDRIPGGWTEVTAVAAAAGGKLSVFDFAFDLTKTYTFWSGILGGTFLTLASHGTDQLMVQRLLAARSRWESQKALLLSGVVVFFQFALFLVIGVMLYAYDLREAILVAGQPTDHVFPEFIVREMPAGLRGVLVAAVFAAAMSTTSSTLNALASSTVVDFLCRRTAAGDAASDAAPKANDDARLLRLSRWITLAWGAVLLVLGTIKWGPLLEAGLAIASITYGSLLGLFLLGLGMPRATARGALVGMFAGLAVILWVHLAGALPWTWYVLVGTTATFAVGAAASLLDNPEKPFGAEAK